MLFRTRFQTWAASAVLLACFSVGPAGAQPNPADKAYLVIKLPASAKLYIGANATLQTGPERHFLSPPLQPNKNYVYDLAATWTDDKGKEKKVERILKVRAGQRSFVDLLEPELLPKPMPEAKPPVKVEDKKSPEQVKELPARTFLFTYAGAVKGLKPGDPARVWLPRPQTTPEQQIQVKELKLPNANVQVEKQYGNQMYYFEGKANKDGLIPFEVQYEVTRREVRADKGAVTGLDKNLPRFLLPDAKVPIDGKPLELIKDKKLPADPTGAAKVLYDLVNQHMEYRKDKPGWGNGDSVWACDSKFGNCTDFHSLFISLARSQKIPAKFEMGFSIPEQPGKGEVKGYHCWAWFHVKDKGWVPVDISEANLHPNLKDYYFGNLSSNRVQFTTGRDLTLEPPQTGKALNFFIYPYVEVNGQPYLDVERRFAVEDVKK